MKAKIIIVDDEEALRMLVRSVLEAQGYEVLEAANLQSVRQFFPDAPPALVILDLNLPDGNGLKLLPEIQRHWPSTKVLILTGYGTVEAAESAYQVTDVYFQCKPFDAEMLKAMVGMALAPKPSSPAPAAQRKLA
jgi:DNA-binding NtrC family response regulator